MGEDEAEEELRRERSEFLDVEEDIILKDAIYVSIENWETIGVWLWISFSDKEEKRSSSGEIFLGVHNRVSCILYF